MSWLFVTPTLKQTMQSASNKYRTTKTNHNQMNYLDLSAHQIYPFLSCYDIINNKLPPTVLWLSSALLGKKSQMQWPLHRAVFSRWLAFMDKGIHFFLLKLVSTHPYGWENLDKLPVTNPANNKLSTYQVCSGLLKLYYIQQSEGMDRRHKHFLV